MTIRLNGATSGYTEIDAPSAAGSNTLILPTGNGSASQYLQTNGTGTLSWNDPFRMVLETAKAWDWNGLTTNEFIDFENIPSWVKRVTVMFSGVSTNGTSNLLLQIGSGSITTSGYVSGSTSGQVGVGSATSTAGFIVTGNGLTAANNLSGHVVLTSFGSNAWVQSGVTNENAGRFSASGGNVTLSGTLDRIRITTVAAGATNRFDAGTINILYEG